MQSGTFATSIRKFAAPGGRRNILRLIGLGGAAALTTITAPSIAARQSEVCDKCALLGVTGGGVVRIEAGDANLVLFASKFVDSDAAPVESSVRWNDPSFEGGLNLESTGPLIYSEVKDEKLSREIRGIATINGEREEPFVLVVNVSLTPETKDRCNLTAGDFAGSGASTGWGYAAVGDLVGGKLLLIGAEPDVQV